MEPSRESGTQRTTPKASLYVALSAFAIAVAGLWFQLDATESSHASVEDARLARLENALARETENRANLDQRLDLLEASLARLHRSPATAGEIESGTDPWDTEGEQERVPRDDTDAADASAAGFDADRLARAGVDPAEIERLRDLWEANQMAKVSLLNRALREGYFLEDQHNAELAALDRELREDLEGEDYDLYLYASGEPNQVKATRVFSGTAASEAGLRPNDVILSYGDERIFKPGDLVVATSKGRVGESVDMEILRDGERVTLFTRRGPLGVLMEHTSGPPAAD